MQSADQVPPSADSASRADAQGGERQFAREPVARAFGAALRELRMARKFTQEHLAEVAGFNRTYPSLLERALRTPTLGAVLSLSRALGVAPEYLVSETTTRLRSSAQESEGDDAGEDYATHGTADAGDS